MIVKNKDFRKTKKILYGLLPLPIMMIMLPIIMIFIKDVLWNLKFDTNFGKLIEKNLNWKFILVVAIHEVIIYFIYIYFVFFKNKKNQPENKATLTKQLKKLENELKQIDSELEALNSDDPDGSDAQEVIKKNSAKEKLNKDIKELKAKLMNISKSENES